MRELERSARERLTDQKDYHYKIEEDDRDESNT